MVQISLPLLADLNSKHRTSKKATLVPRYIARIGIEQLSQYLSYERIGKKRSIRINPASVIVLDEQIQRGVSEQGTILQEDKKIHEIAKTLLGLSDETPKAFLGTLVWNVRDPGAKGFRTRTISEPNEPLVQEITFDTEHIYLTDSAHRHLGICEAYRTYMAEQDRKRAYPRFDAGYEFAVEIYHLNKDGEKMLFNELNSKQKKITSAKRKELDTTTPIGALKDRVLELDAEQDKLFERNIEVTENRNSRHTLMTMSVLTQSLSEMYPISLVKEAQEEEDLKNELAQYYCDFFYTLRDEIKVRCNIRKVDENIKPFESLYLTYIKKAEDAYTEAMSEEEYEESLRRVREEASKLNEVIRDQEKIHSNAVVRALARTGGLIRKMKNWRAVIKKLQNDLIVGSNGRLFQASNPEMTVPRSNQHPIAHIKDDGTLNIQVQSHTLKAISEFLESKLSLIRPPTATLQADNYPPEEANLERRFNRTLLLSSHEENYLDFNFSFFVGSEHECATQDIKLKLSAELKGSDQWRTAAKGSKAQNPASLTVATGYEDAVYEDGIKRLDAHFRIDLPAFDKQYTSAFDIEIGITYCDLAGQPQTVNFTIPCQKAF